MNTLAPSFLIGSSSFLQVTRTCMKAWMSSNFGKFATELRPLIDVRINSRRDSPVRGQIYLLKIASIYSNFTPIGAKNVHIWVFLENRACAKSYQIYFESEKVCQKKTYLSNFSPFRNFFNALKHKL